MKTRIITGVAAAALTVLLLLLRGYAVLIGGTLLLLATQHEVMNAFGVKGIRLLRIPVYASGVITCAAVYFFGMEAGTAALLVCLFIAVCFGLFASPPSMERLQTVSFTVIYPAICMMCLIALEQATDHLAYPLLICGIFAAVGSDTFAFLVGSTCGRHNLCPALSPKKTVEGAIGGLAGGVVLLLVAKAFFALFGIDIPWMLAVGAGLLGAAASQIGDLFASAIKRYCGIKDFSSVLPGHGGILDRLDGVYFSVASMYLCYFVMYIL